MDVDTKQQMDGDPPVLFFTSSRCSCCPPVREALKYCQNILGFQMREVRLDDPQEPIPRGRKIHHLPSIQLPGNQMISGMISRDDLFNVLIRHL